jgi:hypothetical protein
MKTAWSNSAGNRTWDFWICSQELWQEEEMARGLGNQKLDEICNIYVLISMMATVQATTRRRVVRIVSHVLWACERTTLTNRPPLIGKVSSNLAAWGVSRGQCDGSLWPYSRFSRPELLLFLSRSYSIVFTRLSGPHSRPTTSQKIWQCQESNLDLRICSQELWPLDHRGG